MRIDAHELGVGDVGIANEECALRRLDEAVDVIKAFGSVNFEPLEKPKIIIEARPWVGGGIPYAVPATSRTDAASRSAADGVPDPRDAKAAGRFQPEAMLRARLAAIEVVETGFRQAIQRICQRAEAHQGADSRGEPDGMKTDLKPGIVSNSARLPTLFLAWVALTGKPCLA